MGGTFTRQHAAIERPRGAPYSFVCPKCDYILWDEVDYTECPRCALAVDWVDVAKPLWCCETCDELVNEERNDDDWPMCSHGHGAMRRIYAHEQPVRGGKDDGGSHPLLALAVMLAPAIQLAQLVVYALDPLGFAMVAPILLVFVIGALAALVAFVASLGELRSLARDRTTRAIHGFEHGCINLIEQSGTKVFAGQTVESGYSFELERNAALDDAAVRAAVVDSIRRIGEGETRLAYSAQCGTSMLVGIVLAAFVILIGSAAGLIAGLSLRALVLPLVGALILTRIAARPLGLLAQHTLTVSTRFKRASVDKILRATNTEGNRQRFHVWVSVA